jgi:hypothetical protein
MRFMDTSDMSAESYSDDMQNSEWQDWYRLTPHERWSESMKLWEFYLSVGGSLDPDEQENQLDDGHADVCRDPGANPPWRYADHVKRSRILSDGSTGMVFIRQSA